MKKYEITHKKYEPPLFWCEWLGIHTLTKKSMNSHQKSMNQHVSMYDSIPFSMNRLRRKYEFIPLFDKSMNQHVKMYDSIPFSMNRLRQKYDSHTFFDKSMNQHVKMYEFIHF